MKHCNACGFDNEDTAKFCTNCGKTLPTVAPIPPEGRPMEGAAPTSQGSFQAENPSMSNGGVNGTIPPQGNGFPNQAPYGTQNPNMNQNPTQNQKPGFVITTGSNPGAPQGGMNPNQYGRSPEPVNRDPLGGPAYSEQHSYGPRFRPFYLILMLPFFFLFLIFLIGTFMDWTGFPFLFLFGIPSFTLYKLGTTPKESPTVTIKTNIPREYKKGNFVLVCIALTIVLTFVGIAIVPM